MLKKASFLRTWVKWFVLILSGSTALIFPLLLQYEKDRIEIIKARETSHLTAAEHVVKSLFHARLGDVRVLAQTPAIHRYLTAEFDLVRSGITQMFQAFCRGYGEYDQIHLIRLDGQELFRVNYAGGQCIEVPRAELQNKVNRYYFREAARLADGQVFVSPLDLNVEHGKIEEPYKPMIRFATTVTDDNGKVKAVLVLNYLAKSLIDKIFPAWDKAGLLGNYQFRFLLNAQGYYLKSEASPDREFAFMFERDQERFSKDYPDVWQAILEGKTSVRTKEGLFLVKALPVPVSPLSEAATDVGNVSSSSHWYVVYLITNPSLLATSILYGPYSWVWYGLYLLVIASVSALWSEHMLRRDELMRMTESLQNTMTGIEHAGIDVHWVDFETGRVLKINRNMERLLGYSEEELLSKSIWDIDRNLSSERYLQVREAIRDNGSINFETLHNHRDGRGIPMEVSIAYRDSTSEMPAHFVAMAKDITERKDTEQQRDNLVTMIEKANDCFYQVDLDDGVRMINVNEATERHFGFPRETICTWRLQDWDANFSANDVQPLIEQIKAGDRLVIETRHRVHGGEIVPVEISVNHYVDKQGRNFAYGWFKDITERLETERLQQEARERAEAANAAKSEFLTTMSHEIRTPLNAIVGMVHLMRQSALGPEQLRDITVIQTASGHLLDLINNILDFSKIEAGELTIDPHDFFLPELLQDLRRLFTVNAEKKGLSFEVSELSAGVPKGLYGDGKRLKQMLINLLGNAIKFTDSGEVSLTVSPVPGDVADGQVQLRFAVKDSGKGIAPEAQSRLFQPFSQEDASTTRRYGGTGLGLSIVYRLAGLMGGSVGEESKPGRGSTFWLELPFAVSETASEGRRKYHPEVPQHVLVVDDDPVDREVLTRMCANFGWDVLGMDNGRQLVEQVVARADGGKPIDCLLLDWKMPEPDGVAALNELKARIDVTRMPSVIMITGQDVDDVRRALGEQQPDGILAKPVSPSALFNTVNEAAVARNYDRFQVIDGTEIQSGHSQRLAGVRLLLVDDNRINLKVTGRILEVEGAATTSCGGGREAVEALEARPDGYDLVLMDLQMPGMDGVEATRVIRQRLGLELPVIALTAGATTTEQERASDAGMDDFLTKPVDPKQLVRVVRRYVERSENRPLPLAPQLDAQKGSVPAASSSSTADLPTITGIDKQEVLRILGGRTRLFPKLLDAFLAENADVVTQVQASLAVGDRNNAAKRVHKICGQAADIGALALRQAADDLESTLNSDTPDWDAPFQAFSRVHRELFEAADAWRAKAID